MRARTIMMRRPWINAEEKAAKPRAVVVWSEYEDACTRILSAQILFFVLPQIYGSANRGRRSHSLDAPVLVKRRLRLLVTAGNPVQSNEDPRASISLAMGYCAPIRPILTLEQSQKPYDLEPARRPYCAT